MKIFIVFISVLLSSCATNGRNGLWGNSYQDASQLPDFTLCENIVIKDNAPDMQRASWATEIQKRNINCNQYASLLNALLIKKQESLESGAYMLQYGQQLMQQSRPYTLH